MQARLEAPLRISVLCAGSYVSGMEIVALAVMRGLKRRGHHVTCLVNAWNDGDFTGRLKASGLCYEEVHFGKISPSLRPKYVWWTLNALAHLPAAIVRCHQFFRRHRPDVVILYNRDWALMAAQALRRQRVVFHVQELSDQTRRAKRLYRLVDRMTRAYAALSKDVGERLLAIGIDHRKVHVVHNGVVNFGGSRASAGRKRPLIGIVGQIGSWKGHDDLIEALRLLKTEGIVADCVVIGTGDPDYVQALRERIVDYGMSDQISFQGFVADQRQLYDHMDICVVPSRFAEPFGLVAAEAGAHAIPVIATRRGGLPEIVRHGETGFLVASQSPPELAARIKELILDPTLRLTLGTAAQTHILRHFTEDHMVAGIEALCRMVAAGT